MNNTLGNQVLIDFYNCKASFTEAEDLQPLVERAFHLVGAPAEGITFFHIDDELTCMAVSGNAHISIHAYPLLSYVAVDIYSFNIDLKTSQIMNALKVNLRSDRIKATSIRRGDFGSIRDMRPTAYEKYRRAHQKNECQNVQYPSSSQKSTPVESDDERIVWLQMKGFVCHVYGIVKSSSGHRP